MKFAAFNNHAGALGQSPVRNATENKIPPIAGRMQFAW
jgi:hypothetical protein